MNARDLNKLMDHMFKIKDLSLFLWGQTGVGKSQMTKDFCKRHNIGLVDIRLGLFEVGDLMGMPRTEDNRTVYDKPIWFPEPRTQEGLKIACNRIRATGKKRGWTNEEITKEMRNIQESCKSAGILLLDELNRASRETLQGVFQLVYDRRINTHILPKGWWIVVCGNPEGSDYFVEMLDAALMNRFLHIKFIPDKKDWLAWAHSENIDSRVTNFIAQHEEMLGIERINIPLEIKPKPRSWEMFSKVIKGLPEDITIETLSGLIGETAAITYITSQKEMDQPVSPKDILNEYKKVRPTIQKYCGVAMKGAKHRANVRLDLLKVTGDNLLALLSKMPKDLTKGESKNLEQFLLDIPPDYGFSLIKDFCSDTDAMKRVHDAIKGNDDLFQKLMEAADKAGTLSAS